MFEIDAGALLTTEEDNDEDESTDDESDDDNSNYEPTSEQDNDSLDDEDSGSVVSDNNKDTPSEAESTNIREARSDENTGGRLRRMQRLPSRYEPTMDGKSYPSDRTSLYQDKVPTNIHHQQQRMYSQAVNVIFNQMHASKGIKLFKEKPVATIFKEYKQLNDMCVLGRMDHDSLTEK